MAPNTKIWEKENSSKNVFPRLLHQRVTTEIQKAVELGYRVLKIHEVWHFQEQDRRTGLFADYVNTWLKIKQESAGWPDDCRTPEEKQNYIRRYQEREGITLENVAKNPERKQVAKMMLNSWVFVYVYNNLTCSKNLHFNLVSGRKSLHLRNTVLKESTNTLWPKN